MKKEPGEFDDILGPDGSGDKRTTTPTKIIMEAYEKIKEKELAEDVLKKEFEIEWEKKKKSCQF